MFELDFAKEPFDSKLFILCFLKKIWIVFAGALLGGLLVGGGNYLTKVTFGGPTLYEIEMQYYVNYYTDPETGAVNTYINKETWESWIATDWFKDRIWTHAQELGLAGDTNLTQDVLPEYISATILTDLHIPVTYVNAETESTVKLLNEAVKLTMVDFAQRQGEILGVEVIDETTIHVKDRDDRTLRACILGAVLGTLAAGVVLALYIAADSSIHVPETFTYRYGLAMLGALCKGERELGAETKANLSYKFEQAEKKFAVLATQGAALPEALLAEGFVAVGQDTLTEAYGRLREADGVLVLAEAGKTTGKCIEHVLHELKIQDCPVKGALLYGADAALLKAYYIGK